MNYSKYLTNDYYNEFYKRKANGKSFNSISNVVERGIIAAMKRNLIGTQDQEAAEFKRKKEIIEKSIELLRDGDQREKKMAEFYQEGYDKVLKDSENIDDVLKKSDAENIEAVDWWIDKWSDIFDDLADVSESVYNQLLERDLNYTNFKFSLLSGAGEPVDISSRESIFHSSNNDKFGKGVYKEKTGVLEKSTRPEADDMKDRYFDLSFDTNMINAYHDALMDIKTAATVRQIESFFNSDAINEIIPTKEDKDILFSSDGKGVVQQFIRAARKRQIIDKDELTSVIRKLSNLGSAGAATALAGVTQPFKQTIPVMLNTIANAGFPDLFYFANPNKVKFLNESGRAIGIRGAESNIQIQSINKLVDLVK